MEGWLHQATLAQPAFPANIRDQTVSPNGPDEAK
jgi:hypothetical protein